LQKIFDAVSICMKFRDSCRQLFSHGRC